MAALGSFCANEKSESMLSRKPHTFLNSLLLFKIISKMNMLFYMRVYVRFGVLYKLYLGKANNTNTSQGGSYDDKLNILH